MAGLGFLKQVGWGLFLNYSHCLSNDFKADKGKIKTFLKKHKLRGFITTISALQEMLKGVL